MHHITWWDHGGNTNLDNLTLLCQSCHTNVHHFGWNITRTTDGRYHATGPPVRHPGHPAYQETG